MEIKWWYCFQTPVAATEETTGLSSVQDMQTTGQHLSGRPCHVLCFPHRPKHRPFRNQTGQAF